MEIAIVLFAVLLAMFLASGIQVARDSERFAVFVLGRFAGFKGPGLLLRVPGQVAIWHRIKLGDRGELLNGGLARFGSFDLPVQGSAPVRAGTHVRITGFSSSSVVVEPSEDQVRSLRCPKCGHHFRDD